MSAVNHNHICNDHCLADAERVARANIKTTEGRKLALNWMNRAMVVTQHGYAACEVTRADGKWLFQQRPLTLKEQQSFQSEYGDKWWALLDSEVSDGIYVAGFILNGQKIGWGISIHQSASTGNLTK